jgi:hypothetical protein
LLVAYIVVLVMHGHTNIKYFGKLVVNQLAKQFLYVWKWKVLYCDQQKTKLGPVLSHVKMEMMMMMTAVTGSTACFSSIKVVNTTFLDVC